ncbi:DNA translocase FtsK [Candidatus Pandoraea novymonadis]|uniref:DNA translocase FtsK n=1 Tax=Candidatus Pandoraea novymonadis TaxID=1808959 RepID=A0ABX5FE58_9BURK|nr:DNA translocase FtsK [Candidatus Pandoraea novymonadis]PSB92004.1 DNA translocase FtsK [Candidatus Pandoraea novymonadis]
MTTKSPYSASNRPIFSNRVTHLFYEIRWMTQCAMIFFLLMALISYSPQDPSWTHAAHIDEIANWAGRVGAWMADLLLLIFGLSSYWLIVFFGRRLILSYRWMAIKTARTTVCDRSLTSSWLEIFAFPLILFSSSGIEALRLYQINVTLPRAPGGVLGEVIGNVIKDAFGFTGGTLALLLLLAFGSSIFFHFSWLSLTEKFGDWIFKTVTMLRRFYEMVLDRRSMEDSDTEIVREGVHLENHFLDEVHESVKIISPLTTKPKFERVENEKQVPSLKDFPDSILPSLSLLDAPTLSQETVSIQTLEFTSRLIEKKLKDFGIDVSVVAAYPGPVITRYEIEPATGVKGSQIVNLAKDLARSLSLVSIRVVETIPGKNYMGLELPNPRRQMVRLTEILCSEVYKDSPSLLTLAMGKDISGKPVVADLAKMPHLLVAGTTGSGKSVGINAMILSLLYKATADQVRMILIDPKMLEMSIYEGIQHLLCPVVTDMRQAGHALNWVVGEMERRYKLMSKLGVRNLTGYNKKLDDAAKCEIHIPNPFSLTPDAPEPLKHLPYIVLVIDELADLMMVVGKKVEELIARIAQKARAAGIHLILATQRPSVDVITGLIKANVPTRVAFQVSSKIDSRTILEQQGAETLLGMGDMLYLPPGTGLPLRLHGAFVADEEVHRVVERLKAQGDANYVEGVLEGSSLYGEDGVDIDGRAGDGGGESDPLYDQAVAVVLKQRRASISLVQRHLRIGYNRAARLLEQMEKSGIVSAMASNGNREILLPNHLGE